MPTQTVPSVESTINQWGNGLAVRLNKAVARVAGVAEGTAVRVTATPGRIVVETSHKEPTLADMLASFDPTRHGGEVMAFAPVGAEVL